MHCDVSKYDDVYNLFQTAFNQYGRIDHAVSCAGIFETGNWFDPKLTTGTVKEDRGDLKTLDVNVLGTLYFSRIAAVFLREERKEGEDRSLVLLSSVNAFRESPGLYIYQVRQSRCSAIDTTKVHLFRAVSTSSKVSSAHPASTYMNETASESTPSVQASQIPK